MQLIKEWTHTTIPNFQAYPYQQEEFYERVIAYVREQLIKYKESNGAQKPMPAIINASVGTGKSFGIAMLAKHTTDRGLRFMCTARQGELIEQNSDEAWAIGCKNSIYSASLGQKSTRYPAVYGTEGTIANALETDFAADGFVPDVLAIDEAHGVDFENPNSQFMRIINHFRRLNPRLILIGYTGSAFRGTTPIVYKPGTEGALWFKELCNISTEWAIDNGFLLPPHFGFPTSSVPHYDYSGLDVSSQTGDYTESDLERVADEQSEILTPIMREIKDRTIDRNVVLIFAASKRHCDQIAAHLPEHLTAIITADTPLNQRRAFIKAARGWRNDDPTSGVVVDDNGHPMFGPNRRVKYLINCGTLTTGVNIPTIDVVVYLRAVGSLVLLIQSIGRGLRLCDAINKTNCMVLDYADVMARLGGLYNSKMLEEAELERSIANGTTKLCPKCNHVNGEFARRCANDSKNTEDGRCDHFWEFNLCPSCETKNDITAAECRSCGAELRDPNAKLTGKAYTEKDLKPVLQREFAPVKNGECLMVKYTLDAGDGRIEEATEFFWPCSTKETAKKMWRLWVLEHIQDRNWQGRAISMRSAKAVCSAKAMFDCPTHITHRVNDKGKSIIWRRVFRSGRETVGGKRK